jgi:hypothetical protein
MLPVAGPGLCPGGRDRCWRAGWRLTVMAGARQVAGWSGERGTQPVEPGGDLGGPPPAAVDAQADLAGGAGELGGHVQHPVAERGDLATGQRRHVREADQLGPADQGKKKGPATCRTSVREQLRPQLPAVHPLRQRARAHRERAARLVPLHRYRHQLYRALLAMGEPVGRVLWQPHARRVARDRAVRHPARSPGPCRRLEKRVQHLPSALGARHVARQLFTVMAGDQTHGVNLSTWRRAWNPSLTVTAAVHLAGGP